MLLPQKIADYYNRELSYLRHYGTIFSRRFPKIARRLGMTESGVEDPHVERLIESFAFLTASIHQKIDEDMPELNQAMMEVLAPQFIRQIPSVSVVHFQPEPELSGMTGVLSVPRHTELLSRPVGEVMCRFRTVYPVDILPIHLTGASLTPDPFGRDFTLELNFTSWPGARFQAKGIRLYLNGTPTLSHSLYELLLSQVSEWSCSDGERSFDMSGGDIRAAGFGADECLCADDMIINPVHHLFRDYCSLAEKFLFIELPLPGDTVISGPFKYRFRLKDSNALRRIERVCDKIDINLFRLNCTPVVNLFPHKAEPLVLSEAEHEYLIQPDVRRPYSMEVYSVMSAFFFAPYREDGCPDSVEIKPLLETGNAEEGGMYWQSTQRISTQPEDHGMNTFIGFTDLRQQPATPGVEMVMLNVMCTNRDVPQKLNNGHPEGDFEAECSLPGVKVKGLIRPRPPVRPLQDCTHYWKMIAQFNLNHMLLAGSHGAKYLRETLALYNIQNDVVISQLISALQHVNITTVCARLEPADPYSLAKGLEVTLTFQLHVEEYVDFFLFCSVLERFIALYAPVNSFTQVVTRVAGLEHLERRWPRRCGRLSWL